MKKVLTFLLAFLCLSFFGCSTSDTSYFLYKEDMFSNKDFSFSVDDIYFSENNEVVYIIDYIKHKTTLPNISVKSILFSYNGTGYDYLQINNYTVQDICLFVINDEYVDIEFYDFSIDVSYKISIIIDFSLFLKDYSSSDETIELDYTTIEVYLDVSTRHLVLRSNNVSA